MEKFKKVGKVLIPVTLAVLPLLTFAITYGNPNQSLPSGNPITLGEIKDIIQTIAQFLIVVGVIIAVIMIIWGGILWITSGGGERLAKGKSTVLHGIIGAAIVLGVGVILQTIAYIVSRQIFQ